MFSAMKNNIFLFKKKWDAALPVILFFYFFFILLSFYLEHGIPLWCRF